LLGKVRTAESCSNGGLYPGGISHTVSLTNTPVSGVQLQPLLAIPDVVVNLDSNAVTVGEKKHLKLRIIFGVCCILFLIFANCLFLEIYWRAAKAISKYRECLIVILKKSL
jgi:hypothetical protein